eukprot:676422-Rhodomonas_salina.2
MTTMMTTMMMTMTMTMMMTMTRRMFGADVACLCYEQECKEIAEDTVEKCEVDIRSTTSLALSGTGLAYALCSVGYRSRLCPRQCPVLTLAMLVPGGVWQSEEHRHHAP